MVDHESDDSDNFKADQSSRNRLGNTVDECTCTLCGNPRGKGAEAGVDERDVGGVKDERELITSLSIAQPYLGTTEFVSQKHGTENVPSSLPVTLRGSKERHVVGVFGDHSKRRETTSMTPHTDSIICEIESTKTKRRWWQDVDFVSVPRDKYTSLLMDMPVNPL